MVEQDHDSDRIGPERLKAIRIPILAKSGRDWGAQGLTDQVRLKGAAEAWRDTGERLGTFDPVAPYSVLCDIAHPNFGSALI